MFIVTILIAVGLVLIAVRLETTESLSSTPAKTYVEVAGLVIALVTLIKALHEYVRQGAQKRFEQFTNLRKRFRENPSLASITDLLPTDDQRLENVPLNHRREFLGSFEEAALMVNSRLLDASVAHYMFGYFAIRCADSVHFWKDIDRLSPYWSLFMDFAETMRKMEREFAFERSELRF